MRVGIIIVTFNSQKDIPRLFESLIIQQYKNFTVYVVDNNSSDGTLDLISNYYGKLQICVITTKVNNGYAGGNNIGIRKAMDDKCDFVFILNPDMQLDRMCIKILIERIVSDEKIGVIGPIVLLGYEEGNRIQNYGVRSNFRTQKKNAPYANRKLSDEIPVEIYVDYVIGGAMMIRSSLLMKTGLFEEDYFMYNDELDLAYRIKKTGYKTLCMRDAIIRHFHIFDKKNKSGNNLMYYYIMRNRYLYFRKFHLYFNFLLSLIFEIFNFPFTIQWALKKKGGLLFLKFYYSGLWDGILGEKGMAKKSF